MLPAFASASRGDLELWLAGPAKLRGPAHAGWSAAAAGRLEPAL